MITAVVNYTIYHTKYQVAPQSTTSKCDPQQNYSQYSILGWWPLPVVFTPWLLYMGLRIKADFKYLFVIWSCRGILRMHQRRHWSKALSFCLANVTVQSTICSYRVPSYIPLQLREMQWCLGCGIKPYGHQLIFIPVEKRNVNVM